MSQILFILRAVLQLLLALRKSKIHEQKRIENDKIRNNPADWFNGHFDGGVRKSSASNDPAVKADNHRDSN